MKVVLCVLLLLPAMAFAQCPQWINEPLKNTYAFMGLLEQRLSFKFSDTSLSMDRNKLVFNDENGRYVMTVAVRNDTVENINFEAPIEMMKVFTEWFEREFLECATSKVDDVMTFPEYVVVTRPISGSKSYFYMSSKKE